MERKLERDIYLDAKGAMTYDEKEGVELHLAAGSYLRYPKDIAFVDGQEEAAKKKDKKAADEAEAKKKAEEEEAAKKKAEEAKKG